MKVPRFAPSIGMMAQGAAVIATAAAVSYGAYKLYEWYVAEKPEAKMSREEEVLAQRMLASGAESRQFTIAAKQTVSRLDAPTRSSLPRDHRQYISQLDGSKESLLRAEALAPVSRLRDKD